MRKIRRVTEEHLERVVKLIGDKEAIANEIGCSKATAEKVDKIYNMEPPERLKLVNRVHQLEQYILYVLKKKLPKRYDNGGGRVVAKGDFNPVIGLCREIW